MKLLRLAPENTKFGFMRFRRVSYPLSAALSIISVVLFLFVGMNFGIDFAGGTQVDIRLYLRITSRMRSSTTTVSFKE